MVANAYPPYRSWKPCASLRCHTKDSGGREGSGAMLEAVGGQLGGLVAWVMGWVVQFARVGLVLVGGLAILKVIWAGVQGSQREAVRAVVGLVVVAVAFAALAE